MRKLIYTWEWKIWVNVLWKWQHDVKTWEKFNCTEQVAETYFKLYWNKFVEYEESWMKKNIVAIVALFLSLINTGILLFNFFNTK